MKPKLLSTLACLCILCFACRKYNNEITTTLYQDPIKQGAINYIVSQLNSTDLSMVDLSSVELSKLNDTLTMLNVSMKDKSSSEKIFLTYDKNGFSGNWVQFDYKGSYDNGVISTRSFDNQLTHKVSFINGKVVKLIVKDHGQTNITVVRHPKVNIPGSDRVISIKLSQAVQLTEVPGGGNTLPDVVVTGYIYNYGNVLHQLYSLYYINYGAGLRYTYSANPPNSSVSPAGGVTINSFSGPNAIGNIGDYNNCFDNVPGADHKYTITLCVDQPAASSRSSWGYSSNGSSGSSNGGNPVDVGHSFVILTEVTPQKTITRNVGFYPAGSVSPLEPTDVGQLNNNESHFYDVALTVTVTSSQFFGAINFINGYAGRLYDLNNNNCTNFALGAMSAAGINILTATGSWPGGSGKDPGDLGEDIRAMALSPNMLRSSTYTSHPNAGSCY